MRFAVALACLTLLAAPALAGDRLPAAAMRTDAAGHSLPVAAARRLGSPAFRAPGGVGEVAISPDGRVIFENALDPYNWLVGRDAVTGRVLWRAAATRDRKLSGVTAEPGRVRLLERLDIRTVRPVWFDQSTGAETVGNRVDLGPPWVQDRTVTLDPSGRWLETTDFNYIDNDGVEDSEVDVVLHDRLGRRPAMLLGRSATAFAPDGRHLVVTPGGGPGFKVLDLTTGDAVRTFAAPGGWLLRPVVSPGRKRLAAWVKADDRRSLRAWDFATGESVEVAAFPAVEGGDPDAFCGPLAFSADAARLTYPRPGGGWAAHDFAAGRSALAAPAGATLAEPAPWHVDTLLYAPDGKTIFTKARLTPALVPRDIATGAPTAAGPDPAAGVAALHFATDGRLVALAGDRVLSYDPATGKELHRSGPLAATAGARFSADGTRVAVGDSRPRLVNPFITHAVRVCDTQSGKQLARTDGFPTSPPGFDLSPDGTKVVTLSSGRPGVVIGQWDARTGKLLAEWQSDANESGGGLLTLSPDGKTLVHKDADFFVTGHMTPATDWLARLSLWDLTNSDPDAPKRPRKLTGRGGYPDALAFAPDGRTLYATNAAGLNAWNVAHGTFRWSTPVPGRPVLDLLVASADGNTLAAAGPDNFIRLFDADTGRETRQLVGHEGRITALAISPDNKWLASASPEAPVFVWPLTK